MARQYAAAATIWNKLLREFLAAEEVSALPCFRST